MILKISFALTATALSVALPASLAQSNIDPAGKNAWAENVGWTNWRHNAPAVGDGAAVTATHLGGFVWAENVGWINLGNGNGPYANNPANAATFGVNVDPVTGELFGKSWAENIGWVNFDTRATQGPSGQQARLDFCDGRFRGYAWGENIGWINLDNATHPLVLGPDCQPMDVACDGEISLIDYDHFSDAVSGPGVPSICPLFDSDGDVDVDLADFADFQAVYTGP